jgi:electron transport complex protein RnfC
MHIRHRCKATQRRLWHFHGGLHLPDNKDLSTQRPITRAAIPSRLILPLQQHLGEAADSRVRVGERVLKGQLIAAPRGYVSAPVHASTSGVVVAIGEYPVPHPSGLTAPCIVIEADGEDCWGELPEPLNDYRDRDPALLRERIRDAGIVGMGGATFPTGVKLNPGAEHPIETLILNGAECEPYISCDDMLMRERTESILAGLNIIKHILKPKECLIGIEDNKPAAIEAMCSAVTQSGSGDTQVVTIPTLYPSGGEKQLARILTGQEVPRNSLPAQIGIVCHNVATATAVADAVLDGKPLISRIVSVTGRGVREPGNFDTLIGSPAADLIAQAGGYTDQVARLILGGPMMGFTVPTDAVPVTKGTNCLLAASAAEAPPGEPARACIRCGECARVCPARLLPQQLYWYARAKDLEKVQDYNLFDCIECGCCSHVCPSHIPLVQYYRYAKTESWAQEQEKRNADHARERHEARLERVERLERERKARLSRKKAALHKGAAPSKASEQDAKKAAIEAAMRRAAEKKATRKSPPRNTEDLTEAQQRLVEAADASRRRATAGKDRKAEPATEDQE